MTFVDTSFWVAFTRTRDEWHAAARSLLKATAAPLVTSNHVLGETWTTLNKRVDRRAALGFLGLAERTARLRIIHVDDLTEEVAWQWLRRHDEREYSFVDATSFALMRRMEILDALAFDGDFSAAGFVELRP